MDRFTIYCTPEQTKKALELGAPIGKVRISGRDTSRPVFYTDDTNKNTECDAYYIPTAEQMIGYLEEKYSLHFLTGIDDEDKFFFNVYHTEGYIEVRGCNSRKEATLAAIDATLEYLANNKQKE